MTQYIHDLSAPRAFPTVNKWHGGPRWKYAKEKAAWLREIPPAARHRAKGHRLVTLVRVFPKAKGQRRYDPDNLRAGAKPILDSLKAHGWLVNDSPKWCSLRVDQRHPGTLERCPLTIVLISDATREDPVTLPRGDRAV